MHRRPNATVIMKRSTKLDLTTLNRLRQLARLVTLGPGDRRLIIEAGLLQAIFAVAARLLPLARVNRLLRAQRRVPACCRAENEEVRALWAIAVTARHLGFPCLAQALAARVLLERCGLDCRLRLGVDRADGRFEAHAWLERGGRVVVGGAVDRFAAIWAGE